MSWRDHERQSEQIEAPQSAHFVTAGLPHGIPSSLLYETYSATYAASSSSVMTAGAPSTQRHAPSDQRLDCSGIARSVSLPVPCRVPHLRSRSKYGFDVPAAIRDMKITLVVFLDQPVHKLTAKQRAELGKKNISFVFQQSDCRRES